MLIMVSRQTVAAARVLTTLAASVVLAGCAMKGDVRDLQDEIRALAARQDSLLTELRAETRSTQDTLRTQTDQMFNFRGDINQSIRQIGQSLARLEALAGENQRAIAGVRDQLANARGGTVSRPGGTGTPLARPPGGGSERLLPGGEGNSDETWNAAQTQYTRGSFNAATMAFEQFLQDFPGDPRAADAHMKLADILVEQGRHADAIEAFERVQELYPTAQEVPNAMFRIAMLHIELGNRADARTMLERIVNTYPDEFIATLARGELEKIG